MIMKLPCSGLYSSLVFIQTSYFFQNLFNLEFCVLLLFINFHLFLFKLWSLKRFILDYNLLKWW